MTCIRRLFGAMLAVLVGVSLLSSPAYARREIAVTHTNIAPVNKCGSLEEQIQGAINVFKLDAADAASLREQVLNNGGTAVTHQVGRQYDYYTQCKNGKVVNVGNSSDVIVWRGKEPLAARSYKLPSGRIIDRVLSCGNWTAGGENHHRVPPPPLPPVAKMPPPEVPTPPTPITPAKEEKNCFDWNAVIGVEKELVGGNSLAGWGSGSAYVHCWRGELFGSPGLHEIGGGVKGSTWNGRTDHGRGEYKGSWFQVGPAYQFIADDCWLLEARAPMLGRLEEKFRHNGGYKSKRQFTTLGADLSVNWYKPRCENDKSGIREVQANVSVGIPIGKSGKHSFEGQPIQDESDLMKLGLIAQAGVRVYVGGSDKIHPYGDLGTFLETPGSWTGSGRFGVAFGKNRCVGIHAGPNIDFKTGDIAPLAVGAWWDIDCSVKGAREERRDRQVSNLGEGQILEGSGFTMVSNDEAPAGEPIGQVLVSTDTATE